MAGSFSTPSPSGRGLGGAGHPVRAFTASDPFAALVSNPLLLTYRRRPGLPPAVHLPFFARPKKRRPKKRRPTCRPSRSRPYASLQATCGARPRFRPSGGGAAELATFASLSTLGQLQRVRARSKGILQCPCPPLALRSSAHVQRGLEPGSGHCCARPANEMGHAWRGLSWTWDRQAPAWHSASPHVPCAATERRGFKCGTAPGPHARPASAHARRPTAH